MVLPTVPGKILYLMSHKGQSWENFFLIFSCRIIIINNESMAINNPMNANHDQYNLLSSVRDDESITKIQNSTITCPKS